MSLFARRPELIPPAHPLIAPPIGKRTVAWALPFIITKNLTAFGLTKRTDGRGCKGDSSRSHCIKESLLTDPLSQNFLLTVFAPTKSSIR